MMKRAMSVLRLDDFEQQSEKPKHAGGAVVQRFKYFRRVVRPGTWKRVLTAKCNGTSQTAYSFCPPAPRQIGSHQPSARTAGEGVGWGTLPAECFVVRS